MCVSTADAFGRFEFLCRHGALGRELMRLAADHDLAFRVYAAAPWPRGSALVFESDGDMPGSFREVHDRGVWWELGRRHPFPGAMGLACSPDLGKEALAVFDALLPVYERIAGSGAVRG